MKITRSKILEFAPLYDPSEVGMTDYMSLTPVAFIDHFRGRVKDKADIIWLLCRKEFMLDKDIRLFAVWCAREALRLINNPDTRIIDACDIAERFANEQATREELAAAWDAAWDAARADAWDAACAAACAAARADARDAAIAATWVAAIAAAWDAACAAARADARDAAIAAAIAAAKDKQIDKLRTFFV